MAKANKRAREGKKQHKLCNEYKIPIELRKNNKDKFTTKENLDKIKKM